MKTTAKLSNLRVSPQKVRLVTDLVIGLNVSHAEVQLENLVKKSSPYLQKIINSAVANAENNFGLDRNNLYIQDIQVSEGTKLKRWMPRAYGRATKILKRSSIIVVTLEERVEGKNRKTKEQLEKEKKEREETRKKMEKEMQEEQEKSGKEEKKDEILPKKETREEFETKKTSGKENWAKKIFRRKSG